MTERFFMQGYSIWDSYNENRRVSRRKACKLLNELNDECEFLKIENEAFEHSATLYAELYHKSLKENEQLKKEVEDLKQIYQKKEITYDSVDEAIYEW